MMLPIIERLFYTFSSWEEANENYLDGFAWWSCIDMQLPDSEYQRRVLSYERLQNDPILFDPLLWLTAEEAKPLGYTSDYKYLVTGRNTCTIVRYRGEQGGGLVIPETLDGNSVTQIGRRAFYHNTGFTGTLTIPSSVIIIDEGAFEGCEGFTGDLIIPENVTTIGVDAFYDCVGFSGSLVLPESITTIDRSAFNGCQGISGSLVLPGNITTVGGYAFARCAAITNLVIPASLTIIDAGTFFRCKSLVVAEFLGDAPELVYEHEHAFENCAPDFHIIYNPDASGWSTPEWNGLPAFPKEN